MNHKQHEPESKILSLASRHYLADMLVMFFTVLICGVVAINHLYHAFYS